MRHVIFGGDGFVGRFTAQDLLAEGERVLIADLRRSPLPIYDQAEFLQIDITSQESVARVPIGPDDVVYNMAARMLHPIVRRRDRYQYFYSVDFDGAVNVIDAMERAGCRRLVQFSTDMVYGPLQTAPPVPVDHPRHPIGEYSASKKSLEDYCIARRADGLNVSIFRPRLIAGPGRLGILGNLFKLIRHSLPVPLIGNGRNRYQMVSVFDCASAAVAAARKGVPNLEFNLGSDSPPTVRDLLSALIEFADSRSVLVPVPAAPLKVILRTLDRLNLPLLVPEQFEIADADYVVDIEPTRQALDWFPKHSDRDMILEAYRSFVSANTER
jgi:dTDP-glucose 4,6-dehydratase